MSEKPIELKPGTYIVKGPQFFVRCIKWLRSRSIVFTVEAESELSEEAESDTMLDGSAKGK